MLISGGVGKKQIGNKTRSTVTVLHGQGYSSWGNGAFQTVPACSQGAVQTFSAPVSL